MESKTQSIRECKNCGQEFTAQRKDANFCSGTCRWTYWKSTKNNEGSPHTHKEKPEQPKLLSNLQGVITSDPNYEVKEVQIPNPDWTVLSSEKEKLLNVIDELKKSWQDLQNSENAILNETGNWMVLTGILGGAISGHAIGSNFDKPTSTSGKAKKKIQASKTNNQGSLFGLILGGIGGAIIGNGIRKMTEKQREEKKNKALENINEQKKQLLLRVVLIENKFQAQCLKLNNTAKFITSTERKRIEASKKDELPTFSAPVPTPIKLKQTIRQDQRNTISETVSKKIISSSDLEKMDYQALNFTDKWAHFFGYPSINFHCVIHGMSGEGKSTFAIQFANYLAENFGKVIYVSGEEGFSKTFKDKFINNAATSDNLFVADIRKLDEMFGEIPNDEYNFIFIDSLDNMRIDADDMKKIRTRYKDSALITISQSTKEGKMRGSYEIVHDSDIGVKVENGNAITTKNRFKQKGIELNVF